MFSDPILGMEIFCFLIKNACAYESDSLKACHLLIGLVQLNYAYSGNAVKTKPISTQICHRRSARTSGTNE